MSVLCVSLAKLIIDNSNLSRAIRAESTSYQVILDDTNRRSGLLSTPTQLSRATYMPSRYVSWEVSGPAYAPEGAHIGFNYSKGGTWAVNYLKSLVTFTGVQSFTLNYEIIGTFSQAKIIYDTKSDPVESNSTATVVDLPTSSTSITLNSTELSDYSASFNIKVKFQTTSTAAVLNILSLTINYTCDAS
jgi:hypothetical protein